MSGTSSGLDRRNKSSPPRSIQWIGAQLRSGALTATALVDACLERIAAEQPRLNAFICIMAEQARRQAELLDRELAQGVDRGPLHGIPISIKDLVDIEGIPTTAASHVRRGHLAGRDAVVVAHLRRAGVVFIGKTNLHEFGFGATNEDSAYGPARNPYDLTRSPGGSSGGAGASLAANLALGAVGTDTGGSIRIPASACGVVGLKPSYGELSVDGVVPLSRTLDHVGPLAHSVADTYVIYRAMLGDAAPRPFQSAMLRGARLSVLRSYFCDVLDHDVSARFEEALVRLRVAGAALAERVVPHVGAAAETFTHIQGADAAAYHASTIDAHAQLYSTPVRLRIERGRAVLAEDYLRALKVRELLRAEVDEALLDCDALVVPSLAIPPPCFGVDSVETNAGLQPARPLMLRLTQLFNLTGHPSISIPSGTTGGLPCGLQLIGHRMATSSLLAIAAACEAHVSQAT